LNDRVLLRVSYISSAIDKTVKKFFSFLYEGPCKIGKILNNNTFQLSEIDDRNTSKTNDKQKLKEYLINSR